MFFNQIRKNAARKRQSNALLYGSLVSAIVAFYTLLSLRELDVMKFLTSLEGDAIRKLMMLIPLVYILSLFFVFFLVYFANKYEIDSRRKEFGLYQMLGMRKGRLFAMLFGETLWNSLLSLLMGMPLAFLLSEGLSLISAKIVGLGIIGHRLSFSPWAIGWTVVGFLAVQILSVLIICIPYGKAQPADLLRSDAPGKQLQMDQKKSVALIIFGILFLLLAYALGLFGMRSEKLLLYFVSILAVFVLGILGSFFFYRGLGPLMGRLLARRSENSSGLTVFTGRQVQESVLSQHKTLAIASLLLLAALASISYGIAMGIGRNTDSRTADFSVMGTETAVKELLAQPEMKAMVVDAYPVYLSSINRDREVDFSGMTASFNRLDPSGNLGSSFHLDYLLSLSSYNQLRVAMGREPVTLGANELALYSNLGEGENYRIYNVALKEGLSVVISGQSYTLNRELLKENIVADRAITLAAGLVAPDDLYREWANEVEPLC